MTATDSPPLAATAAPEPAPAKRCVVSISAELHALLKAKATKEGRVLSALVESKLWELVQPELLK